MTRITALAWRSRLLFAFLISAVFWIGSVLRNALSQSAIRDVIPWADSLVKSSTLSGLLFVSIFLIALYLADDDSDDGR
ncbi:hypothetical protein GCM10008090_16970 [Arenicella chitinivorans]|uniref:Uncharacterized protein n=1 Tax=Arenicella chitinivorans TaxID=1329800 RepID=A0A918RSK8_9GAMM|nr:hypothetical protein [Arenicella chitinivorans]GHA07755.1 hypothetical protein GCM10008090_16970 [Arenicella chitinivorans]